MKIYCSREDDAFYGAEKLLNLVLSDDNKFLLSSGEGSDADGYPIAYGACEQLVYNSVYTAHRAVDSMFDGITLWDVKSGKPLRKFAGTDVKTIATISPDDKYIIAGDEDDGHYVWFPETGKQLIKLDDTEFGRVIKIPNCHKLDPEFYCQYDDHDGLIPQPRKYHEEGNGDMAFSQKFIDLHEDYLALNSDKYYAILYNVNNRRPLKYFYLGSWPAPVNSNDDYSRDEAIDSAPEAHILVVGQRYFAGIIVYKFDPKKLTLKKVWISTVWPWEVWWYKLSNLFYEIEKNY